MKKLFILTTFTMLSFNVHAIVGKSIKTSLKDQVCSLETYSSAKRNQICTGVRISQDYVLTAQHCVRDPDTNEVKSISLRCDDDFIKVQKVFESKEYINSNRNPKVDFALIKIASSKKSRAANIKMKLTENFSEYRNTFLSPLNANKYVFAEKTLCEMHGYGLVTDPTKDKANGFDGNAELQHKAASIVSTFSINDISHSMELTTFENDNASILSPILPIKVEKADWSNTFARVGDSGGPLFCKAKTGEWILAGITSIMTLRWCPDSEQPSGLSPDVLIAKGRSPKACTFGTGWGVPTKETLEKVLGVRVED